MVHGFWGVGRRGALGRGRGPALVVFLAGALVGACNDGAGERDSGFQRDGPLALAEDTLARCTDGKDNDDDGKIDCADEDCAQLIACKQPDAAPPRPENTADACRDGADNDGDGKTDCADEECALFVFCVDGGAPGDAAPSDAAPADHSPSDALRDAPQDAPVVPPADAAADAPADSAPDAPAPDLPLAGCSTHCDCPQGSFCYKGTCVQDPKLPVYCCAKTGCPPGKLCMDLAGQQSTCAEDVTYGCQTACDCGPAHCCVSGKCVKDTNDPWLTGGTALPGLSCSVGTDPTYCCADFACHEGRAAYEGLNQLAFFNCFDPVAGQVGDTCGGTSCFGTACNCADGEVCVDTVTKPTPPPGSSCHQTSGGACMSGAAAEAIFGWAASDLLSCCKAGCAAGSACDAGWRRLGGRYAYQRVVASCGPCADGQHHSCGLCGNNKCDVGEYPATCPQDCSCGDGSCAPQEVAAYGNPNACPADCGTCGDGACNPGEDPVSCASDCGTCGDGWCTSGEVGLCSEDCWGICRDAAEYARTFRACGDGARFRCDDFKTCAKCAPDCPESAWTVQHYATTPPSVALTRVWGSSATDVYALSTSQLLHFDGASWTSIAIPQMTQHADVWGSSATDVYVAGTDQSGPALMHFDGAMWNAEQIPAPAVTHTYDDWVYTTVGGTGPADVFLGAAFYSTHTYNPSGCTTCERPYEATFLFGCAVWRFDGAKWQQVATHCVDDLWGNSSSDVFGAEAHQMSFELPPGLVHIDSGLWNVTHTTPSLGAVWGTSPSDVFAAGDVVAHFNGSAWQGVADTPVHGIWGTAPSNVFAVGGSQSYPPYPSVVHFDGTSWQLQPLALRKEGSPAGICGELRAVWGTPSGAFFAVGDNAMILTCSGPACAPAHAQPLPAPATPDISTTAPTPPPQPPQQLGTCGNGFCDPYESCAGDFLLCETACSDCCG